MDDLAFESNGARSSSSPKGSSYPAQQPQNQQSSAPVTHGAFGNILRDNKDSPNRKQLFNKKGDMSKSRASPPAGAKAGVSELSPQALAKNKDLQAVGGGQSRALGDVKDLGVVGGKKRGDQNDSQSAVNQTSTKEDSFQKLYSKELDLDEDEVPIILHELNDSAIHFISHEQYERSLSLLQKAQTLLDRLKFQKNPKDRFLIQVTMHNMALCFQKMGALEECALCLDACLHQINSQYLAPTFTKKPTKKLKKLKYECKIHMQVCALLSQLHRHEEALLHAKQAVQISQYLVNDLVSLCELNVEKTLSAKKNEQEVHEEQERQKLDGHSLSQTSSQADLIYYDHSISMLERTALRVYPIIKEIQNRMVKHKDVPGQEKNKKKQQSNPLLEQAMVENQPLNMKVLLGYLNQSEWLYLLNIGNIMQITPLTIHDLYSNQKIDVELSRDSILEKITFLAISYFCVSTELRFLVSSKEKLSFDPVYVKAESEFWHGKALEISCGFLPSESPLVTHVLSSYQKHHAPVQQAIPENEEEDQGLRVIRPEKGIDKAQFQPIVRQNKHLNIALSPLRLSANNHNIDQSSKQQQPKKEVSTKDVAVFANLIPQQPASQPQVRPKMHPQQQQVKAKTKLDYQDEEASILLKAAQMHNPSQRSIEFMAADVNKAEQQQYQGSQERRHSGVPGPDIVEYELQSFDQNDIVNQQQKAQQQPSQTNATPGRSVDQQQNNKIQMAVPSPNALASAMQLEQREQSLSQASIQERPQQLQKYDSANKMQTQRHTKTEIEKFAQDKQQSSSFQVLPKQDDRLLEEARQQQIANYSQSAQDSESIEDKMKIEQQELHRVPVNNYVKSYQADNTQPMEQQNFANTKQQPSHRSGAKFDQHQAPRPGAAKSSQLKPPSQQENTPVSIMEPKKHLQLRNLEERVTPDNRNVQKSSHGRLNINSNADQSNRSRSKGKISKKKGVLTQPQTHQNSANTTNYDPLRQVKEVTQFGSSAAEKKQARAAHSLETTVTTAPEDSTHHSVQVKSRNGQASSKTGLKTTSVTQASIVSTKAGGGRPVTSLEVRGGGAGSDLTSNQRPPSSNGATGKQERPDSRRMIGGKRRQIKDQPPVKQDMSAARSNSAGRRNNNNLQQQQQQSQQATAPVNQMQNYKTNEQVTSSQQQPSSHSTSNFKTYQQSRKAVTAHSTQASNSPSKRIPSGSGKPVQDPVFMSQNQSNLNQSRSTIENNNSMLIDRSMNDQLMLNNSSFEIGTQQSRSRSFAKTGALSQQNSREVMMGQKKKNVAHPPSQTVATQGKSQSKQQKAERKEMLTYLNQGTAAQKSMNSMAQAQNPQKFNQHHQVEVDYRKQLLIKQALEIQQHQNKDTRQKSTGSNTKNLQTQQTGKTQVGFQAHSSSVQTPMNHTSQVQHAKPQSRSSQGLRKSQNNIQKDQSGQPIHQQSQKVLSSQAQQNLDPQAIAAINQMLTMNAQSQNAQQLYSQLMHMNQTVGVTGGHQVGLMSTPAGNGASVGSQKKPQNTHTMIKKFLKERAGPQVTTNMQGSHNVMINQNTQGQGRVGNSQSPTPGTMHGPTSTAALRIGSAATLIDNFTQAPFLASSTNGGGSIPSSKQAHTTKSAADAGKQVRNFLKKAPVTNLSGAATKQTAPSSSNSYYQEPSQQPRKGASERFDKKQAGALGIAAEPGQREPTPVYLHVPYSKGDEMPAEMQYPTSISQQQHSKAGSAKQQLASMYKSIKGGDNSRH